MFVRNLFRLDLKHLILLLAFSTAAVTLINGLYASYQVQRQLLIDQTLESNQAYARKLADITTNFLLDAQTQLAFSARELSNKAQDPVSLHQATRRLLNQSRSFSSVFIIDPEGLVLSISPDIIPLQGQPLSKFEANVILSPHQPSISEPFVSNAGNLVIVISQPIFSREGDYIGNLGGTLYLKESNILSNMLGQHFYQDGSYLYVVDQSKRLIYHPQRERVGEQVLVNPVIDAVVKGEQGMARVVNSKGVDMLAGYAPIPAAGWGVVAQRPVDTTLAPLKQQILSVITHTLPITLATLVLILLLARWIANPLRNLAENAQSINHPDAPTRIQSVRSWYFESTQLKLAMLKGMGQIQKQMGQLRDEATKDPLTGLANRRSLDTALEQHLSQQIPFTVLAVDVDHFKTINDNFGHGVGDQVLKTLARQMSQCFRRNDLVCRAGGEEFVILLPDTSMEMAWNLAERLRRDVESTPIHPLSQLHISIGMAEWPLHASEPYEVLKYADKALYRAKQNGRNRCESHQAD